MARRINDAERLENWDDRWEEIDAELAGLPSPGAERQRIEELKHQLYLDMNAAAEKAKYWHPDPSKWKDAKDGYTVSG